MFDYNEIFTSIPAKVIYIFFAAVVIIVLIKLCQKATNKKCKCQTRLEGKVVLITGGNSGIGLETARDLAKRGARIIIASRDTKKSADAVAEIVKTTGNRNIEFRYLDLSKFSSIKTFAEDFNSAYDRLDILINNAGCGVLKHKITEDGFNKLMQINYFGHFLLTSLLLNKIINSKPSRIINISSYSHFASCLNMNDFEGRRKRHYSIQYSNSKLCMILWTKALAEKLPKGVTANVLHPGLVQTPIFKMYHIPTTILTPLMKFFFKNSVEGAQTTIHLAVSEDLANKTGGYYGECGEAILQSWKAKDKNLIDKVWNKSVAVTGARYEALNFEQCNIEIND